MPGWNGSGIAKVRQVEKRRRLSQQAQGGLPRDELAQARLELQQSRELQETQEVELHFARMEIELLRQELQLVRDGHRQADVQLTIARF